MKANLIRYIGYGLALTVLVITAITITACSSPSTPAATSAVPSTPGASSTPSASNLQQAQGTVGTLNSINGNTLTLTNVQGSQVTVNVSDTTSIQKSVAGTMADLQQGDFLTVSGTPDASGNIAATAISVRAAGQGFPTRSPGATFTPRGTPYPTGTGSTPTFPNGGIGRGTSGTLAGINGNTLTLATAQGNQVTVNISDATTIEKTVEGTISDLQPGESLIIMGASDANGNIIARSISIRPQGQGVPASPPGTGTN